MTSQTWIKQAFHRPSSSSFTIETKLKVVNCALSSLYREGYLSLWGNKLQQTIPPPLESFTWLSLGTKVGELLRILTWISYIFNQDTSKIFSFPRRIGIERVCRSTKEIKFQEGETLVHSSISLPDINVTLLVYSPNSTSLTFIHIQTGNRLLPGRGTWHVGIVIFLTDDRLSCKDETRFRYPCYRHNPPWQFIRCSILDISLSNFLELSRIVASFYYFIRQWWRNNNCNLIT